MNNYVKYEKNGVIAVIRIDRQEVLNALDSEILGELEEAVSEVEKDRELRALIITGAGRAFVAGASISEMKSFNIEDGRRFGQRGSSLFRRIEKLEIPTIAAVNGFALGGGCELAMSCDIILAGEKAKFGQPEVGLGITPGFSGTQRLPRRIGASAAKELLFSARVINAEEAFRLGLANAVYPTDELMDKALEMADTFASKAPIAVKYAKACVDRGMQTDIDSAIAIENELFAMTFATADQKEGMTAFLEKRPANFTNS